MEEKIKLIHEQIKSIFPDAIKVNIIVSSEGIEAIPIYKTNMNNISMKTITGRWITKIK